MQGLADGKIERGIGMGKRRRARELALRFLYSWDLVGGGLDEALAQFEDLGRKSGDMLPYACEMIRGTAEKKEDLDKLIDRYCANWDLKRIAVVDKCVLRMALWEMLYGNDVPPVVAINEAVDIAKKYSTAESGGFVNGILDRIRNDLLSDRDLLDGDKEGL